MLRRQGRLDMIYVFFFIILLSVTKRYYYCSTSGDTFLQVLLFEVIALSHLQKVERWRLINAFIRQFDILKLRYINTQTVQHSNLMKFSNISSHKMIPLPDAYNSGEVIEFKSKKMENIANMFLLLINWDIFFFFVSWFIVSVSESINTKNWLACN
jgi:hypothetical protein